MDRNALVTCFLRSSRPVCSINTFKQMWKEHDLFSIINIKNCVILVGFFEFQLGQFIDTSFLSVLLVFVR